MSSIFPEPPTRATLDDARRVLAEQRQAAQDISARIQDAEDELDRIVKASQNAIQEMQKERSAIEDQVAQTLAYLSHIRRLPHELLGQIFTFIFEDYPCCAWVLAAVCSLWRREVLSMPKLWSKIRLVTTPQSSPDTVRLWLERSGSTVPLDIEIFLHTHSHHAVRDTPSMHRRAPTVTLSAASAWEAPWWENDLPGTPPAAADAAANGPAATYIHIPANGPPHFIPIAAVPNSPPLQHHHVHAGPAPIYHEVVPISSWRQLSHTSRSSGVQHWGYIAFYYLMQQMHRWERFVFRFDRQFPSINALKSMVGDAPLLREFEVSGAEPALLNDWSWLPCAKTIHNNLEHLSSLTLQYVPFKWSSPIFQNLQTLNLRTLPANTLALDRILYILSMNTQLVNLSLHITSANPAVLPLTPTTLEHVKSFAIGGHFLLAGLVDVLTLPAVDTLSIDIEARDPIEETLTNLLIRSSHPPVARLSISYGLHTAAAGIYYHAGSAVTAWNFLGEMDALRTLQVGGAPFEPLVAILGTPEDDGQDQWYCPNLVALSMKACRPSHSDGVAKLVQMVEARNPDPASGAVPVSAGGITPVKLRHLELYDCTPLGLDVIRWLNGRITDVVCTEPSFDTASLRSPSYHYL